MDRVPTIKDIARRTGLSTATVSRALHDAESPFVSQATRVRVRAVAEELGYKRNQMGLALVTGRTNAIGLWTANPFTPYYSGIAREANALATAAGMRLAVQGVATPTGVPDLGIRDLRWQVDGIIASDMALYGSAWLQSLSGEVTPVVEMGIHHTQVGDFVGVDLYAATCEALLHLLEPGCRRVAYVVNLESMGSTDPRSRAYADITRQAGIEPLTIVLPVQGRAPARASIAQYVREHPCPEAIFCINDEVAIGCYRGLCDAGMRIPDDVALVGCDGLEDTEYHFHPISTIVQPVEQTVRLAWDFLQNRIQDPHLPPQQVTLVPELAARDSSRRTTAQGRAQEPDQGG